VTKDAKIDRLEPLTLIRIYSYQLGASVFIESLHCYEAVGLDARFSPVMTLHHHKRVSINAPNHRSQYPCSAS